MREKMEDVRGPRFKGCADLTAFHSQFPGEGGKLVTVDVFDLCEGCSSRCCASIYFELCCLIVGEFFSSLPSWAMCAEWEGEGGTVIECVSVFCVLGH